MGLGVLENIGDKHIIQHDQNLIGLYDNARNNPNPIDPITYLLNITQHI